MKIYLAGGMSVMNNPNREYELAHFGWRRLYSYHYITIYHMVLQSFKDIKQINKKYHGNKSK